jgi:hypothetical protein
MGELRQPFLALCPQDVVDDPQFFDLYLSEWFISFYLSLISFLVEPDSLRNSITPVTNVSGI